MRAAGVISLLLASCLVGCTHSSTSAAGRVGSAAAGALPTYVADPDTVSVLLVEDPSQNWFRIALNNNGAFVNTGQYRFSPGVVPIQALHGRILLTVDHYPPAYDCQGSCPAPIPTRSLAVADANGRVLWQVPDSLGECSATLVPGTNEVVAAVVTSDAHGHALARIRLLTPAGLRREIYAFIPRGGCPGLMSATPDGAAVYVPTGQLGGAVFRVPLHQGTVTPFPVGEFEGHSVAVAVSPDGSRLAVSAMTYRPISPTTDTNDYHLSLFPSLGGQPTMLRSTVRSLTTPVWAGRDLLIATQSQPRYAMVLVELNTGTTRALEQGSGFRVFGALA